MPLGRQAKSNFERSVGYSGFLKLVCGVQALAWAEAVQTNVGIPVKHPCKWGAETQHLSTLKSPLFWFNAIDFQPKN